MIGVRVYGLSPNAAWDGDVAADEEQLGPGSKDVFDDVDDVAVGPNLVDERSGEGWGLGDILIFDTVDILDSRLS